MLPCDLHVHTRNSPDGSGTVREYIARAETIGLAIFGITDHVEMNRFFAPEHYALPPRDDWEIETSYGEKCWEASLSEITASRSSGKTRVLCGMEMGQPNADFSLCESVIRDVRLDYVIASLHELSDQPDFYGLHYDTISVSALLRQYFEELESICRWGKFDILAHMTYPFRYIPREKIAALDRAPLEAQIRACLQELIRNDCALEVNTSGLRQVYGKTLPTLDILRLYRELGGTYITLGSDAHTPNDLAAGISEGLALVKAAGFREIYFFEKRDARAIPIESTYLFPISG